MKEKRLTAGHFSIPSWEVQGLQPLTWDPGDCDQDQRRKDSFRYSLATTARKFDIVMARVPFSDSTGYKIRPFMVWRDFGLDFWGFPMTGHAPRNRYELALEDWDIANLPGPGSVRVASGCSIDKHSVMGLIGTASKADVLRIACHFAELFMPSEPSAAVEEILRPTFQ